jgi:hypothetical protein
VEPIEHRAAALASFGSAWRTDAEKIADQLATAWRLHLETAIDNCLRSTEAQHAKHVDQLLLEHAFERRRFIERLAQSLRRLRQFESETQWSATLADAAQLAAKRVLVFSINVDKLRLQAARGFDPIELAEVPLAQAAAFQAAVATSEPAVALKTKSELSAPIAAIVGEDPSVRFAVYPVTMRQRVPAVVYAESPDAPLLDLIVTAAGAALESHMGGAPPASNSHILTIAPAAGAPFVTRDEEERHSRAQRFARVQVAEIRLYHSQAVKSGRADNNLYRALQSQIDGVRRVYQEQYLMNAPNMADYLHQEILRTLANGNSELLGPDYPGPLV